jgi:hypothetical protein
MGTSGRATDVPGCSDAVVDGVTGLLVWAQDPATLAALDGCPSDPELRRLHGAVAREPVLAEFRPEMLWEETYREFRCQLREHAPGLKTELAGAQLN